MKIFAKLLLLPILIILFMIGWIAYICGDRKYHAKLEAQAKVIIREEMMKQNDLEKKT